MIFLREAIILILVLFTSEILAKDTRKMIAVIDTGISPKLLRSEYLCKDSYADFTGTGIADVHGHGTNVAGIIINKLNYKTHCIVPIKYWHSNEAPNGNSTTYEIQQKVLQYIKLIKPAYINMSFSGYGFNYQEYDTLYNLMQSGTKIVVAAGNNSLDLSFTCDVFPACYFNDEPNFFVVGAKDLKMSNKKGPVNVKRPGKDRCGFGICMSGTSQAAAEFTADLISKEK